MTFIALTVWKALVRGSHWAWSCSKEKDIVSPHRLHAVHRCGPLLHMSQWFVCLSVWHTGELCKNGWITSVGPRNRELDGAQIPHHGKGAFLSGTFAGPWERIPNMARRGWQRGHAASCQTTLDTCLNIMVIWYAITIPTASECSDRLLRAIRQSNTRLSNGNVGRHSYKLFQRVRGTGSFLMHEDFLYGVRRTIRYDIFTCAQKLTIWPA